LLIIDVCLTIVNRFIVICSALVYCKQSLLFIRWSLEFVIGRPTPFILCTSVTHTNTSIVMVIVIVRA